LKLFYNSFFIHNTILLTFHSFSFNNWALSAFYACFFNNYAQLLSALKGSLMHLRIPFLITISMGILNNVLSLLFLLQLVFTLKVFTINSCHFVERDSLKISNVYIQLDTLIYKKLFEVRKGCETTKFVFLLKFTKFLWVTIY
jgi:hypothetical protein